MIKEVSKTMITYAGLKKYEEELHELKAVRRQEVAEKIKVAREQGDLSENADYDAAKEEQTEIEKRIVEIENILRNAEVAVDEDFDPGKINVGCEVTLLDLDENEELVYYIVGSSEANSLKGKISNESPVGAGLMGHSVGDTVNISFGDGIGVQFKVLDIKKAE